MKIAIIGNGKLSKRYGKQIDKADIVIRFNQAITDGFEQYVGKKTTVLSLVGETSLSYTTAIQKISKDLVSKCQSIWFSSLKPNKGYEKLLHKMSNSFFVDSNEMATFTTTATVTDMVYIGFEAYKDMCKKLIKDFEFSKHPSTGINTICTVLDTYNIFKDTTSKLDLYGFDNFKTGHYFDKEKRNNKEFHPLDYEKIILESLKEYKNIKIYN